GRRGARSLRFAPLARSLPFRLSRLLYSRLSYTGEIENGKLPVVGLFFRFVGIGVRNGAVGIGLLGFAPGSVEFDETADGLLCLRVLIAQGGLQPCVAGQ